MDKQQEYTCITMHYMAVRRHAASQHLPHGGQMVATQHPSTPAAVTTQYNEGPRPALQKNCNETVCEPCKYGVCVLPRSRLLWISDGVHL